MSSRNQSNQYTAFIKSAMEASNEVERYTLGEFLKKSNKNGRWHPNGFAIFDIKRIENLGFIRLHIWTSENRIYLKKHPRIHNHGFHIYSKVLTGTYSEIIFEVAEAEQATIEDNSTTENLLTEYVVKSDGMTNQDIVECTGRDLIVKSKTGLQNYPSGTAHQLKCGEFHSTIIRPGILCATLAVMGERHHHFVDRLVGKSGFEDINTNRVTIPQRSARIMFDSILER